MMKNKRPSSLLSNIEETVPRNHLRKHDSNNQVGNQMLSTTMRNDGSESPLSWHKKGKVNPTSYLTSRINLLQAEISDVTRLM